VTFFFWFLSILGGLAAVRIYVLRHPLAKDPDSGLENFIGIVGWFVMGAFLTRTAFFLLAVCWMLFSK
jgi:hypothetical protein